MSPRTSEPYKIVMSPWTPSGKSLLAWWLVFIDDWCEKNQGEFDNGKLTVSTDEFPWKNRLIFHGYFSRHVWWHQLVFCLPFQPCHFDVEFLPTVRRSLSEAFHRASLLHSPGLYSSTATSGPRQLGPASLDVPPENPTSLDGKVDPGHLYMWSSGHWLLFMNWIPWLDGSFHCFDDLPMKYDHVP